LLGNVDKHVHCDVGAVWSGPGDYEDKAEWKAANRACWIISEVVHCREYSYIRKRGWYLLNPATRLLRCRHPLQPSQCSAPISILHYSQETLESTINLACNKTPQSIVSRTWVDCSDPFLVLAGPGSDESCIRRRTRRYILGWWREPAFHLGRD